MQPITTHARRRAESIEALSQTRLEANQRWGSNRVEGTLHRPPPPVMELQAEIAAISRVTTLLRTSTLQEVAAHTQGLPQWFPAVSDGSGVAASAVKVPGVSGVAVDASSGRAYVACGSRLLMVHLATGRWFAWAGQTTPGWADGVAGEAQFRGIANMAVDAARGRLLVADSGNHRIRAVMLPPAAPIVTTVAGTGYKGHEDGPALEAHFSCPTGLSVERSGVIWVADRYNNCVRVVTPALGGSLVVSTIAGVPGEQGDDGTGADASFKWPSDVAVTADGRVAFVVDALGTKLRRIVRSAQDDAVGIVDTLATVGSATSVHVDEGARCLWMCTTGSGKRIGGSVTLVQLSPPRDFRSLQLPDVHWAALAVATPFVVAGNAAALRRTLKEAPLDRTDGKDGITAVLIDCSALAAVPAVSGPLPVSLAPSTPAAGGGGDGGDEALAAGPGSVFVCDQDSVRLVTGLSAEVQYPHERWVRACVRACVCVCR